MSMCNRFVAILIAIVMLPAVASAQCRGWLPGTAAGTHGEFGGSVNAAVFHDLDGAGPDPARLIIGGGFETVVGTPAKGVAFSSGSTWTPLSDGFTSDFATINAMISFGGELFIGGVFGVTEGPLGEPAGRNIARWNGSRWVAVGSGLTGPLLDQTTYSVRALAVYNGELHIAGSFESSGLGTTMTRIAKLVGPDTLSSLDGFGGPSIPTGTVYAMDVVDGNLVITGTLASVANLTTNGIAAFNPTAGWFALGSGFAGGSSTGFAISSIGDDLIVGGNFTSVNGVPVPRIARCDFDTPTPTWSALGTTGMPATGTPLAMTQFAGQLYVGANPTINATSVHLFRYTDTGTPATSSWSPVGGIGDNGFVGNPGSATAVRSLFVSGSTLIVGGDFARIATLPANNIAIYNGTTFSALGSGTSGPIQAFAPFNNQIAAGGLFTSVGGVVSPGIALWNGSTWSALGGGISGSPASGVIPGVYALVVDSTTTPPSLVIGGDFVTAGTGAGAITANRIARWNPASATWSLIGTGAATTGGGIRALALFNGQLYAAGTFTTIDGVPASRIARFNGTAWSQVGAGFTTAVNSLTVYDNKLWIGASSNVTPLSTWDGVTLNAVASPGTAFSAVNTLAVLNNTLHVAGTNFVNTPFIIGTQLIFKTFDSSNGLWNTLGTLATISGAPTGQTLQGTVSAMTIHNGELVVTGSIATPQDNAFPEAGGVSGIARWTGTRFSQYGGDFTGGGSALASFNGELLIGGRVTAGGIRLRALPYAGFTQNLTYFPYFARHAVTPGTQPVTITTQPINSTPCPANNDGSVSFTVSWTGPAQYLTWRWNGVPVGVSFNPRRTVTPTVITPSTTSSTITIAPFDANTTDYTGIYDAVLTNECGEVTSVAARFVVCKPDIDCSGSLGVQDIFEFLNAWFAANPNADFDGMNGVDVADIFAFLNAWFAGC